MGKTCIPVVDSFRYLAKQYNIVKSKNKIKFKKNTLISIVAVSILYAIVINYVNFILFNPI